MPQGHGEGSKATQFNGDEPRCKLGHVNCDDTKCPGTGDIGAPSKWKPEYNDQIVAFFDIPPIQEVEVHKVVKETPEGGKEIVSTKEWRVNALPTIEKFAANIDVFTDTLVTWAKPENESKYPGFAAAYQKCKQLQKNILVTNGLLGKYQSNFAIFVAKNFTDMKDKTEVDNNLRGSISLTDLFNSAKDEQ